MLPFTSTRHAACAVTAALLISLTLTPWTWGSGVYKWVDQQGRTHYADRPGAQQPTTRLEADQLPSINRQQPVSAPSVARSQPPRPVVRRTASLASDRATQADCSRYRAQIRKLEKQLSQGYSEPSGVNLHRRKRKWTDLLYERCY